MHDQCSSFPFSFSISCVNTVSCLPVEIRVHIQSECCLDPPCGLLTMCLPALLCLGTAPWQAILISASLERRHESARWQPMTALLEKEDTTDQQFSPHPKAQRGWTMDRAHRICLGINWVAVFLKVINVLSEGDNALWPQVNMSHRRRKTLYWVLMSFCSWQKFRNCHYWIILWTILI